MHKPQTDHPQPSPPELSAAASRADLHILLVRHGQTDFNQRGITQGHRPTSLNELGRRQAQLVARRLVHFRPRIELIISSDLPRAVQTAAPLAQALGLDVRHDRAWRERCCGAFEGKNLQERTALRQRAGLGPHDIPPGAQTEQEYRADIHAALLRLSELHGEARCVAVVTHGGACRVITMMLADGWLPAAPGTPPPPDLHCPNGAVTHLIHRVTPEGPQYSYGCVYDTSHLAAPELVTGTDAG